MPSTAAAVKEEKVRRKGGFWDKKNNIVVKTVSVGTKASGISWTQPTDSSRVEMHKFLTFLTDRPTCLLCDQEVWIRYDHQLNFYFALEYCPATIRVRR